MRSLEEGRFVGRRPTSLELTPAPPVAPAASGASEAAARNVAAAAAWMDVIESRAVRCSTGEKVFHKPVIEICFGRICPIAAF